MNSISSRKRTIESLHNIRNTLLYEMKNRSTCSKQPYDDYLHILNTLDLHINDLISNLVLYKADVIIKNYSDDIPTLLQASITDGPEPNVYRCVFSHDPQDFMEKIGEMRRTGTAKIWLCSEITNI